jgi:hypothetical protein
MTTTLWGWALFAWRFEVDLYKSLFRLLTRRPDVPAGSTASGTSARSACCSGRS